MLNVDDLLGALMAYEVYAAISRRLPLVTTLCRQYPALTAAVLLIAFGHLRRPTPTTQGASL